jgi:ABC-type dipeptide/oligopeptide/nickel transport system permease component
VTETVFDYRGLGLWVSTAATQLDFPTIVGFSLFTAVIMVGANLVVDIMYVVIDPRIRLS